MAILPSSIDMDVDNDTIIRERPKSSSKNSSRESSVLSNTSSMAYHEYMEALNNILPNEVQDLIDSPYLSYTLNNSEREKDKQVSIVTNNSF